MLTWVFMRVGRLIGCVVGRLVGRVVGRLDGRVVTGVLGSSARVCCCWTTSTGLRKVSVVRAARFGHDRRSVR